MPSYDGGCVDNPFRWCDNRRNNDPEVLTLMSKAFANMVVQMAFDNKVMSSRATPPSTDRRRRSPRTREVTRPSRPRHSRPGGGNPARFAAAVINPAGNISVSGPSHSLSYDDELMYCCARASSRWPTCRGDFRPNRLCLGDLSAFRAADAAAPLCVGASGERDSEGLQRLADREDLIAHEDQPRRAQRFSAETFSVNVASVWACSTRWFNNQCPIRRSHATQRRPQRLPGVADERRRRREFRQSRHAPTVRNQCKVDGPRRQDLNLATPAPNAICSCVP